MNDFIFRTTPEIICRTGEISNLGQIIGDRFESRNILVVTDKGIASAGLLEAPLSSLKKAGFHVHLFDNVAADPPAATVLLAAQAARDHDAGIVLGLGGGSSMDTAKLAAILAPGHQELSDIYGIDNVSGDRLDLILVPTTAGTGSEVTPISVVTTGEDTKMGIVDAKLYADLAILDATLTIAMPRHVTAATGIDAMVHAIEAYTSRHRKNVISDMYAREALSLLSSNLVQACTDGTDLVAREKMLLGSMLAGQAFANAPVAGVHAMAYPLGETFHLGHGLSNALVLPHVMRFNLDAAEAMYAELAGIIAPGTETKQADGRVLIDRIEEIAVATGIERRLSQVGINHNHLPRLAADVMKHTRLLVNNPREITEADALAIYEEAL